MLVLLVDVRHGVGEQTRRHLSVGRLLRVPHVIVAVNKIDLVDYAEDAYASVAAQVAEVAAGLGVADVTTIPVSALVGDNIVDRSERTPWYGGPSLLELLETLEPEGLVGEQPFRIPRAVDDPAAGGGVRGVPRLPRLRRTHRVGTRPGGRHRDGAAVRAHHDRRRHRHLRRELAEAFAPSR